MAIPDQQLEIWSRQGAVQTAKATHQGIRNALASYRGWPAGVSYDVYLQGSYANSTNIRADSDVDVVVQCNSIYHPDVAELRGADLLRFNAQRGHTVYEWLDFRRDVLRALRSHYGNLVVREGRHSLKLRRSASHLPADVVPAILYRRFHSFGLLGDLFGPNSTEGMTFWVPAEHRQVINYPKLHLEKGVAKNGAWATGGHYKPAVRMFKNARTHLVGQGLFPGHTAPSYFLECLLHNVPDDYYRGGRQQVFQRVVQWLSSADLSGFRSQNGVVLLFGRSPQQWTLRSARQLINSLIRLWNRGG